MEEGLVTQYLKGKIGYIFGWQSGKSNKMGRFVALYLLLNYLKQSK
jgi:hypothetical protein